MINSIRQVAKHSAVYGLGNISIKIIGLVLIPLYTNPVYFSVNDFGAISLLDVTIEFLIALTGFSLYQAFTRWYWDKEFINKQKSIFFTSLSFILFSLFCFGMPFYLLCDQLALLLFNDSGFTYVLKILYISVSLQTISFGIFTLMKLQSKSILYSLTQILKLFITLGVTIYFIVHLKRGIKGIYEAQIIGHIPYFLFLVKYIFKNIQFHLEFKILREMLKFCLPLVLGSLSATVLTIFDRFSLNYLATLDDVGIYSLGYRIANTIRIIFVTSVQLAVAPIIFKKMYDPDNKRFYSKLMTYQGFLVAYFVLFISIFGFEIIKVFTSNDEYLAAVFIIPVIGISVFFGMLKDTSFIGLQIVKKTTIIGISLFIVTALNMGLNILLIPHLKIHGASLSALISQIALFIIIFISSQKHYHIPYELKKMIIVIIIVAVMSGLSLLINDKTLLARLMIKVLALISFPFLLYLFGFFEDIEVQRIKEAFKKWKNPGKWIENITNRNSGS
ncbi:MAG: polysaccharide biosynthesis C-terminal domain-containing protein [Bacteroidales bacterium]|nr:polysaccharide biosynthesis C-terminal domain-containing protein [Bacteroidales bacterium]